MAKDDLSMIQDNLSTSQLLLKAKKLWKQMQGRYTEEEALQCEAIIKDLIRRVDTIGLFSWNEQVDDLATLSLCYLHLEYWLGTVLAGRRVLDLALRRDNLLQAQECLGNFLKRLYSYELIDAETRPLLTRPLPFVIREVKVSRMKRLKALHNQIAAGEAVKKNAIECQEEVEREIELVKLQVAAIEAQNELERIEDELALLENKEFPRFTKECSSQLDNLPKPMINRTRVTRPFTLVSDRQQLKRDVFRPDHNLPTMTIDEYLELEMRQGGILNTNKEPLYNTEEVDPDQDEASNIQTLKDRKWDAFKDDNLTGWGNTYNLS